jgi:hypothetical protein
VSSRLPLRWLEYNLSKGPLFSVGVDVDCADDEGAKFVAVSRSLLDFLPFSLQ